MNNQSGRRSVKMLVGAGNLVVKFLNCGIEVQKPHASAIIRLARDIKSPGRSVGQSPFTYRIAKRTHFSGSSRQMRITGASRVSLVSALKARPRIDCRFPVTVPNSSPPKTGPYIAVARCSKPQIIP